MNKAKFIINKGGVGSGHHDHAGRPGKVGGSMPSKGGKVVSPARVPTFSTLSPPENLAGQGWDDVNLNYIMDEKALSYLDEGLADQLGFIDPERFLWLQATSEERGGVKDRLITNISKQLVEDGVYPDLGMAYSDVNDVIHQWTVLPSDNSRSLSLQSAASEELGAPLSKWHATEYDKFDYSEGRWQSVTTRDKERAIIRTMYNQTQAALKESGVTGTVTLYRGLGTSRSVKGDTAYYQGNTMESWSVSPKVANQFGGYVLAAKVPVENIIGVQEIRKLLQLLSSL